MSAETEARVQGLHQIEGLATLCVCPLPCPPVTALPVMTERWLQRFQPSHPDSTAPLVCKESLSWKPLCHLFTRDCVSRPKPVLEGEQAHQAWLRAVLVPGGCAGRSRERGSHGGGCCVTGSWGQAHGGLSCMDAASLVLERPQPCSCFTLVGLGVG